MPAFFIVLLNLIIFGLGGLISLVYMVEGFQILIQPKEKATLLKDLIPVGVSLGTLAFIGTQMAWFIRPWFNYEPYFIRPERYGNFYVAVINVIFSRPYIGIMFLFLVGLILIPFAFWISRIFLTHPLIEVREENKPDRN